MSANLQEYIPDDASFVFSSEGYQRIKIDSVGFYSSVLKSINPIKLHSPSSIDTSWTTGNIYLANSASKKLYKLDKDGMPQIQIQLTEPTIVSIVQGDKRKTNTASAVELGVWVVDGKSLKYFDANLNMIIDVKGVTSPQAIAPSNQNGCYLADDHYKAIVEIDSSGQHVSYLYYNLLFGAIDESIVALKTDYNGNLWILGKVNMYKVQFDASGTVTQKQTIQLQSIVGSQYTHSCIDIDRWAQNFVANESSSSISDSLELDQFIYTASGNENDTIICKFSEDAKLIQKKNFKNYNFPLTMKVGQSRYSTSIMTIQSKKPIYDYEVPGVEIEDGSLSYSSSSSESSSSIPPSTIWFTSSSNKGFWKLNTNNMSRSFLNALSFNPKCVAHNPFKNTNYIVESGTNKLYFYKIQNNTTTLANTTFAGVSGYSGTEKTSLCVSRDGQYLWAVAGNKINIGTIDQSTDMVGFYPQTYSLIDANTVSIGECTGISNHPTNGKTYISTRDAIWQTSTSNISIGGGQNIQCSKVVNKPSGVRNGIQDILVVDDGTMWIMDSYAETAGMIPLSQWSVSAFNPLIKIGSNYVVPYIQNLSMSLPYADSNNGTVYGEVFGLTISQVTFPQPPIFNQTYKIDIWKDSSKSKHLFSVPNANFAQVDTYSNLLGYGSQFALALQNKISATLSPKASNVSGNIEFLGTTHINGVHSFTATATTSQGGVTNIFKVNYTKPSITYEGVIGWNKPVISPSNGVFESFSSGVL